MKFIKTFEGEFGSEVSQMKINFDELLIKFKDFDETFHGIKD